MLLIKFLIAKFRELRYHMRKEVWRLQHINGRMYCDCFDLKSPNFPKAFEKCIHGYPKGGYPEGYPGYAEHLKTLQESNTQEHSTPMIFSNAGVYHEHKIKGKLPKYNNYTS